MLKKNVINISTSKGLTTTASVKPAHKPAKAKF